MGIKASKRVQIKEESDNGNATPEKKLQEAEDKRTPGKPACKI